MSTAEDITKAQFKAACKRHGFVSAGYLGYYSLPETTVSVSVLNAGKRRRDQLAYLIQKQCKLSEQSESEVPA